MLDGTEVYQVVVYGCVIERREQSTSNTYVIEDGTGRTTVRQWFGDDDTALQIAKRAECTEGKYVRIVGKVNEFNGNKNVNGFHVSAVTDPNELVHHFLDCMHVHAKLKQLKAAPAQPNFGAAGAVNFNGVSQGGQALQSTAFQEASNGMTPAQRAVAEAFQNDDGAEEGRPVASVINECKMKGFSEDELRKAVEYCAQDGIIYTTVGEDYYKSTSA